MAENKKTKKSNTKKTKPTEGKQRDEHGRFLPGCTPLWSPPDGNKFASKYEERFCEEMIKFFSCPIHTTYKDDKGVEHLRPCIYPTFERFASMIGVLYQTLLNWCESHESFKTAFELCKQMQRDILISNGLSGAYNPAFAKFVATVSHGMVEKTEVDVGNAENKGFEVNIKVID